jgi:hypothetical protein
VNIVAKNSATSWVTSPTTQPHAPGAVLYGNCSYPTIFWKYLEDPHGADTTNTSFVGDHLWPFGGHDDITTNLRLTEGYALETGDLMTNVNKVPTSQIGTAASFAGAFNQCYGDGCPAHPSVGAPGAPWFTDFLQWNGAYADNGSWSLQSGQVYKYIPSASGLASPKMLPTAGAVDAIWSGGPHSFLDASGPGAVLNTGAADNYKYCIANAPGECYPGSTKGDEYVNLPGTPQLSCSGGLSPCLNNFSYMGNAALQIGVDGTKTRVITNGLTGLRDTMGYPTAKALADGSWLLFEIGDVDPEPPSQVLMAKLPPFVAQDTLDRTNFLPLALTLSAPPGVSASAITNAVVQFGYEEQGAVDQYFCTSRREICEAASATIPAGNPFYYRSEAHSGLACAGGNCTITIPVLPMHTVHFQVLFRDATNTALAFTKGISAELSAQTLGGGVAPQTLLTGAGVETGISSATVHWTTNNPTDAQVRYGTTPSYGQTTPLDSQLGNSHSVLLTSLAAKTTYYYQVRSQDRLRNVVTSQGQFMTSYQGAPLPGTSIVTPSALAVAVYPNPWRSDKHAAHPSITFRGLAAATTIKIFTVSGRKVAEIQTDGPTADWNLLNTSGEKVASGVYVYLITDKAGDKVKGKVAVIK